MWIILTSLWLICNVVGVYAGQHQQSVPMWQQCFGGDEDYGCPLIVLPDGERLFVVSQEIWQSTRRGEFRSILPDGAFLISWQLDGQASAGQQPGGGTQQHWSINPQVIDPTRQQAGHSQEGILRFLTPQGWDRGGQDYDAYSDSVESLMPGGIGIGR